MGEMVYKWQAEGGRRTLTHGRPRSRKHPRPSFFFPTLAAQNPRHGLRCCAALPPGRSQRGSVRVWRRRGAALCGVTRAVVHACNPAPQKRDFCRCTFDAVAVSGVCSAAFGMASADGGAQRSAGALTGAGVG